MLAWWIWHDLCNVAFKIQHSLCIAWGSALSTEKFWMHLWWQIMKEEWVLCSVHLCGPLWQYGPKTYSAEWWTLFLSQYMHELFRGKNFSNLICEELLHDVVIGVWSSMSATSIIAPIRFLSHTDMLHMIWSHVLKKVFNYDVAYVIFSKILQQPQALWNICVIYNMLNF